MPPGLLPSLLLSLFAVGYTPGPANIYALSCALSSGRRKAMRAWLGLFTGFATAALLMAVAVHFLGIALGGYIVCIKYLGAAYLLLLAWRTFRADAYDGSDSRACSFWNGFIVQMTNAKMLLFDITVYSSFALPYSSRFADLLPVAALLLIAGPGANLFWLLAGSALRPFISSHQKTVNVILAIALLLCAIYVVIM